MGCSNCGKKKAPVVKMSYTSRDLAFSLMRENIESGKYRNNAGEFGTDLISAFGLQDHPKAEKAYAMAWDKGHSNGYYEVLLEFSDLVELLV